MYAYDHSARHQTYGFCLFTLIHEYLNIYLTHVCK